jgi:hypothetical protein
MASVEADSAGFKARRQWAAEALNSLNEKIRDWILEDATKSTVVEFEPETDTHIFRLATEGHPLDFEIEASNIIHQLRASLDNLVWQLVILNGKEPRGGFRGNSFPILKPEADKSAFGKDTKAALRGMHPEHRAFIERLQPYGEPSSPLWRLGQLSNWDKHQELRTCLAASDSESVTPYVSFVGGDVEAVADHWFDPSPRFQLGAVVARAKFLPGGLHEDVNMQWTGAMKVVLEETGEPVVGVLRRLVATVGGIQDAIEPVFEGEPALEFRIIPSVIDALQRALGREDPVQVDSNEKIMEMRTAQAVVAAITGSSAKG